LMASHTPGAIDLTYCHGLTGHADFLLLISEQLKRVEFRDLADRLGWFCIETFHKPGLPWPCGVPGAGETPGLMVGTAGIGYSLLRLFAMDRVPSVSIVRPAIGESRASTQQRAGRNKRHGVSPSAGDSEILLSGATVKSD